MDCTYCKNELAYHDFYFSGNYSAYEKWYSNSWYTKKWDIYKCTNEDCESQVFNSSFYTRGSSDELHEWYPC